MPPITTRRRIGGRRFTVDPELELDARLDGEPAELVAALEAADAEHGTLYGLRLKLALKFGRFSRTVVAEEDRRLHRATALSYVRQLQRARAGR